MTFDQLKYNVENARDDVVTLPSEYPKFCGENKRLGNFSADNRVLRFFLTLIFLPFIILSELLGGRNGKRNIKKNR